MRKELIAIPSWKYNETVFDIVRGQAERHKKICYVTLNKTYHSVVESIEARGVKSERFLFVDTITPTILKKVPRRGCLFIDSIADLDKFADKLLTFIKLNKPSLVFFDSLSSFLVYHTDEDTIGFFNYILPMLEALKVDVIISVLLEDVDRASVKQLKMNVDASEIKMDERAASLLKW